jgi:hypothetical protein
MNALRALIAAAVFGAMYLGGCDYARPPRPLFCNYYGPHSDGRSPISKWWLHVPQRDSTGVGFRVDHEFNLLLLYLGKDPEIVLNWGDDRVFDEKGYVLLRDARAPPHGGWIAIPNTPDIAAARNRLFAFNDMGDWHDFAIPEGFAKEFERDFLSPCPNPPKKVLVELERFAKQRGLDDLSVWLASEM